MKRSQRRSKSFQGQRDLTLQKYDLTTGSPQISTMYGLFTYGEVQRLLKDGYEILTDWDRCRQLHSKTKDQTEQRVRDVLRSGSAAARKQNATM